MGSGGAKRMRIAEIEAEAVLGTSDEKR